MFGTKETPKFVLEPDDFKWLSKEKVKWYYTKLEDATYCYLIVLSVGVRFQ